MTYKGIIKPGSTLTVDGITIKPGSLNSEYTEMGDSLINENVDIFIDGECVIKNAIIEIILPADTKIIK